MSAKVEKNGIIDILMVNHIAVYNLIVYFGLN